ncbi:MAG: tetratricopeptide repeat protein [Rhodoferax sp.]|nr:tetratricopeptide repeat protein [Rhodoferax sp.]
MVRMKRFNCLASHLVLAVLAATALVARAEGPTDSTPAPAPVNSAMDAELFYQLLLGDLKVEQGEPGAGYSLILDAARKTNDAGLYQRAVDIALQARSGESALQAARAWQQAQPQSRQANRLVLQILVALNRINDTAEPLKTEIAMVSPDKRNIVISAIPRIYERASDKKLAASVVEKALADQLTQPATAGSAWTTVGRLRLAADDTAGALDAAQHGQALDPKSEGPALLALEMMGPKVPLAEPMVRKYLDAGNATSEVRMAYVRVLLDAQRYREAGQQLQILTTSRPDFAQAWLVQGALQEQDNQSSAAEASFKHYVDLVKTQKQGEERDRGLVAAYLSLSQIAEKRGDYPAAQAWLDRIENSQDLIGVQGQRASILAKQGKLDAGLALIRSTPERTPEDAKMKLMAEVQLLRDNKKYQAAYSLLETASAQAPQDTDLIYDQAMLAEKLNHAADMERLLRQLIALKPGDPQAYNALGYSLADRGERLPEAKQLIQKALEYAPTDPFIIDSLGWVEFRMGNNEEAARLLEGAYKTKPDTEIAAHLGEVLWSLGQHDRAISVWKEGQLADANNETLQATLKRLHVKL